MADATPSTAAWLRARAQAVSPDNIRRAIYLVGAAPAALYFYRALNNQLGADPAVKLEHLLGIWALRFLVIGLAITPLRRLGGPNFVRYRRAIGLLAFFYVTLHFYVYLNYDKDFIWSEIWRDLFQHPRIIVGFGAFLILIPLAITSNNAMIKRLGGANWQRLHKWVYLACALAALHFLLLYKKLTLEPLIYSTMVAALLVFRLVVYVQKRSSRNAAKS